MAEEIYLVVNSHAHILCAFSDPEKAFSFLDEYEKKGKCNYKREYVVEKVILDKEEETNG